MSLSPISLRPDPAARLPFACALLAGLCAALQFALPVETDMPAVAGTTARIARPGLPQARAITAAPEIEARPLFAPRRPIIVAEDAAAASPLGGASVAGMVTVRRARYAVVRRADGRVVNIPLGGRIAGWRIIALDSAAAQFRRGSERLVLPFGAATVAATNDSSEVDDE